MDTQKKLRKKYSEAYLQEIFDERVTKIMIVETYRGSIFIELFHRDIPLVKEVIAKVLLGEYDGMTFYNCNPYFIQARKSVEEKSTAERIFRPYLKNLKGTVGLINSKKTPPKSLLDHFYISLAEIPEIDGEYTIIGRVVRGLDVLNKIWDGNTIRRVYIEKGYVKTSAARKLGALYWVGLAMILVYAIWLITQNLDTANEFQKEIFNKTILDIMTKSNALTILGIGVILIIFSLIMSSLKNRMRVGETREIKQQKMVEGGVMKTIKEKQRGLVKELEKYQEKELESKEKKVLKNLPKTPELVEKTKSFEEQEMGKLKAEVADLKKKIEEEKRKEEEKKKIEGEHKKDEEKLRLKFEKERKIEEKKRKSEEERIAKENERKRKEEEKGKPAQEKFAESKEPRTEIQQQVVEKERKKMVEGMAKHQDIHKDQKKKKEEIKKEVLPQIAKKTETQLDVLYDLLEKDKSIKLTDIMKTFSISKEEAIEWCNILVEHELAELKYPAFGDPILLKK